VLRLLLAPPPPRPPPTPCRRLQLALRRPSGSLRAWPSRSTTPRNRRSHNRSSSRSLARRPPLRMASIPTPLAAAASATLHVADGSSGSRWRQRNSSSSNNSACAARVHRRSSPSTRSIRSLLPLSRRWQQTVKTAAEPILCVQTPKPLRTRPSYLHPSPPPPPHQQPATIRTLLPDLPLPRRRTTTSGAYCFHCRVSPARSHN
jgi:hypothetical protein